MEQQGNTGFCSGKVNEALLAAPFQTDLKKEVREGKRKGDAGVCTLAPVLSCSSLHFCWVSGKWVPALRQSAENVPHADTSTAGCWCLSLPGKSGSGGSLLRQLIKGRCVAQKGTQLSKIERKKGCFIVESYFNHRWCQIGRKLHFSASRFRINKQKYSSFCRQKRENNFQTETKPGTLESKPTILSVCVDDYDSRRIRVGHC